MRKKLLSLLLSMCMILSFLSIGATAAESGFSDLPPEGYWSHDALTAAVKNGLLQGNGGKLMPRENLTRAQLAAVVTRCFGADQQADLTGYSDVHTTDWHYSCLAAAVQMGVLEGSGSALRPNDPVTRQEALAVLARAMKLTGGDIAVLDGFTDGAAVSDWAAEALAAMVQGGYIHGEGGRLNPADTMTREQFAQVMDNLISVYCTQSGTYTESVTGNVMVNCADVILSGLTITGDLIVGEGVGNGDLTLDKVNITGRLVVRGGGENSIRIVNQSDVGSIIVGKTGDGGVRVRTEEGCRVDVVYVDDGRDDVILEGTFNQVSVDTDAPVVLKDATVTGLTVNGASADVKLAGATSVAVTQIAKEAAGAKLDVGSGTKIAKVESAAESVKISGSGQVTQAVVSGSNTAVDTAGTKVTVETGASGVTQNGTAVGGGAATPSTGGGGGGDSGVTPHAAETATFAQLEAALADGNVSSISITGVIQIPENTTVTVSKPVTIAALADAQLVITGSLINDSTLTAANRDALGQADTGIEVTPGGSFVNQGTFVNHCRMGMYEAAFTNTGTVNNEMWLHCGGSTLINSGTFLCPGELTLLNSDEMDGSDNLPSTFTNQASGTFTVGDAGGILVGYSCTLYNEGALECGGVLENYGTVENSGSNFAYTAYVLNAGTVTGTLTGSGDDAAREDFLPVWDMEDLTDALSDLPDQYNGIAILGDLTLAEDLTVSDYILITYYGSLTVPTGKTLTVSWNSPGDEFKVGGLLYLDGGALVTTRTGSGEDEAIGQVTIVGGTLKAGGSYTVTNHGVILYIRGCVEPEDMTVGDNEITVLKHVVHVTTEAELRAAMTGDGVDEIIINADVALTSDLDITRYTMLNIDESNNPYTLTVPADVSLTVKDGAELVIMGDLINNGTVTNQQTSGGVFLGAYGSMVNNGVLDDDGHILIFEGELINNGTASISSGDGHEIMVIGGTLTNGAEGTFVNEEFFFMQSSADWPGAISGGPATLNNAGTFANGAIALPAADAHLVIELSTLTNSGTFVNNGNMDLGYADLTNTGTFDTYNAGGLTLTGGSFTTEAGSSFHNAGYMKVSDEYGRDGGDNVCSISLADGTFVNNSSWLEYTASVYSQDGFTAAEAAQTTKLAAPKALFSSYERMDILADLTVAENGTFSLFPMYWVMSQWSWDDTLEQEMETKATLTVDAGVTLTVEQGCTLHVDTGIVDNNGKVATAATTDLPDEYAEGGMVDIWPYGTFNNTGETENNGKFILRSDYDKDGGVQKTGTVTGNEISGLQHLAMVYSTADLEAAVASVDPVFDRIEVKDNSNITLSGNLTVEADMYIEPGSGLIVRHGAELTLRGSHWLENGGDVSVYGTLTIDGGFRFENRANLEIGAVSGGETAQVVVESGSTLSNGDGSITIYATGTLNTAAGFYEGDAPDNQGGTWDASDE